MPTDSALFLQESIDVLDRTPATLDALLGGLPDSWIRITDGPDTWSAYDVLGHLVHCERTDWMTRLEIILEHGPTRPFDPLDRQAQFRESGDKSMQDLLDEFKSLRSQNLARLRQIGLTSEQLQLQGTHPALGLVTLRQLVAAWTAHDLAHIVQIGRTMARRYKAEAGPWAEFLSVMKGATSVL